MSNRLLSRQEKRWLWLWCAAILLLSCVPYVVAWQAAPPGYRFTGVLVNPYDGHSYLAKMHQGWAGSWSFHLTYSPERHEGAYLYLFYLALGHLAHLSGSPLIVVFHLARLVGGLALLLALYRFVAHLTESVAERRLAFLLTSVSAGLGFFGAFAGRLPVDLWVPEGFAFFSLLTNPHFPFGLALMLVLMERLLWPSAGVRGWLLPGLTALLLALVLPFALASVFVVAGLAASFRFYSEYRAGSQSAVDRSARALRTAAPQVAAAAGALCLCLPVVIYDGVVFATNPAMSAWASQNLTTAPAPLDLLLGYGFLWPLAIAGAVKVLGARHRAATMLVVWTVAVVLMVYVPISLQRRLVSGLGLPLGMLAAFGVSRWLGGWTQHRLMPITAVLLCSIGNIFLVMVLILGATGDTSPARLSKSRLFLSKDENAAAEWLGRHGADALVLADERMGLFLPGAAGVRVVYGHPFETIAAEEKRRDVAAFYTQETDPTRRREIIQRYGVDFVLTDATTVSPDALGFPVPWTAVFRQDPVAVLGRP